MTIQKDSPDDNDRVAQWLELLGRPWSRLAPVYREAGPLAKAFGLVLGVALFVMTIVFWAGVFGLVAVPPMLSWLVYAVLRGWCMRFSSPSPACSSSATGATRSEQPF